MLLVFFLSSLVHSLQFVICSFPFTAKIFCHEGKFGCGTWTVRFLSNDLCFSPSTFTLLVSQHSNISGRESIKKTVYGATWKQQPPKAFFRSVCPSPPSPSRIVVKISRGIIYETV